ncbi:MinD/ParA family protein [Candidatus Hydrogenedentota bacterium]
MLIVICACGQAMKVPEGAIGRKGKCSSCHKKLDITEDNTFGIADFPAARSGGQSGSEEASKPLGRSIAITSGKGGVGKSNIVINLSFALGERGKKVLVIDADMGLPNVQLLTGLKCRYDIEDVLDGKRTVEEIIVTDETGVMFVTSSAGVPKLVDLGPDEREVFIKTFEELENRADFILIDTAGGVGRDVMDFVLAADEVLVITTREPTAMMDAYSMLKSMYARNRLVRPRLLVNMARGLREAEGVTRQISEAANAFLDTPLVPLGYVPRDSHVQTAVIKRRPFIHMFPKSPASVATRDLAERLIGEVPVCMEEKESLMKRFLSAFHRDLKTI